MSVNWDDAVWHGVEAFLWVMSGALFLLGVSLLIASRYTQGHWAWKPCDVCRRRKRVAKARRAMHRRSSSR